MVLVRTNHADGRAYHWWARFLVYGWTDDQDWDLQAALDYHDSRARVDPSGYHIGDLVEFETEQDFTMFVLRWS